MVKMKIYNFDMINGPANIDFRCFFYFIKAHCQITPNKVRQENL